ncbi:MAG: hypothetical protein IJX78_00055 [Bacilli bacterium]|nr:hypothetical protein [Bacilli bacterium]
MMNKIWLILIFFGLIISMFTGNFQDMGTLIINSSEKAFSVFLNLALMMTFWNGIFEIAIKSNLIHYITIILKKPLCLIFPTLKNNDIALNLIAGNIIANFLGLGSAATPLGIKTMEELNRINDQKNIASRAMIIFILLNASAPTLFPTSIYSLRVLNGGTTSNNLFILMICLSFLSCLIGIILERIFYRIAKDKPL